MMFRRLLRRKGSSNYKKRRREKDHEDGSDNEDKKRTNHGSASNSKLNGGRGSLGPEAAIIPGPKTGTASHRGIAPKAKPKSSKKSGAHKNNKLKKRHSILEEDETPTPAQTPELEDKLGQKSLEGDFTKAKVVQNQIPIQNFWSFVDQFYRPLTEEDLKFLEFEGDEVTPYVVPPLGRSYKEQWADEEGKQFSDSGASANPFIASATQEYPDTGMLEGNAYIQPLSERIIASLMENRIIGTFTPPAPFPPEETEEVVNFKASGDMMDLEHRMRNELRYIGLIDDDEVDMNVDDQDEISSELRSLQSQLRSQTSVNRMRKRQLRDIATKWMGWQEYNGVLDDINKNIEQAYVKRFRTPAKSKGKKRISRGEYRPMGENVMQHLNNRKRLISELGVFLPADAFTMPTTSIYTPS
ncbi:histone acetyltransferases subunit 3-domain-containing protein [Powellomyces hirtus]|nr:histone acetyltransferases subunit 3-domain-containing protein [Powellomyces hirtus]